MILLFYYLEEVCNAFVTFQEVLKKGEILANLAEADQTSGEPVNIVIIFQYNDINLDSCEQKNSVKKYKIN